MMYSNKLAIAVKANGKVLREFGDTVYTPYGAQYTILIKNLHSVRVQVRVSIDGTSATDGQDLVIRPNQELELQRFIKNGNLLEGNCFKFIERTAKIEDGPRGAKVDDGIIRIEYQFEKPHTIAVNLNPTWVTTTQPLDNWLTNTPYTGKPLDVYYGGSVCSSGVATGSALRGEIDAVPMCHTQSVGATAAVMPQSEIGITVQGSISTQQFSLASWFPLETTTHSMVIHMLGETPQNKPVTEPVIVKSKPVCITCGHANKQKSKFCSECGTSLDIV